MQLEITSAIKSAAANFLVLHSHRYLTEFQSHEPEFDYLKSLEIEEKINKVCG